MNRLGIGHRSVPHAQRGFLLMTAVILIVTVALLATVITFLSTGNVLSSAGHANSAKALFVGESGLERAILGHKTGTFCTSLIYNGTVGEGNFSTTGAFKIASVALGANITAADTIIPVASTAGFASYGRIRIENEDIDYAALTAASFTGARRGVAGSTAAAHNTGATVNVAQDECLIQSTGTVSAGNTERVVEKGLQNPGTMMVYAKANGDGNVYYRRWDGTNWGPERTATAVPADIHFFVLKFAQTRNEAVLGTLSSNGDIRVQVWNGNTQTWSATTLLANIGTTNDIYRGFDIEYETLSDRAIVVYNNANNRNPSYRIWNGMAWSAAVSLNTELGFVYPTAGAPVWVELAPNPLPNSNEMALITLDVNYDVYGARWTGTAWNGMGVAVTWDTSAANNCPGAVDPCKVIDVAYEQLSGRSMFIWGDNANGIQRYRIWDGAALNLPADLGLTAIPGPDMTGEANWVRLAARPNSNQLMYGVQDDNRDLFTANWSGAAWGSGIRHEANTEDRADRNFDVVYETNPANSGFAWLMWGRRVAGPDFTARRQWNPGTGWGGITNFGVDSALVQLAAHPLTGRILAGIYHDSSSVPDNVTETHFSGGVWLAETVIWNGPTVGNPVNERLYIAPERYSITVGWREIFQ